MFFLLARYINFCSLIFMFQEGDGDITNGSQRRSVWRRKQPSHIIDTDTLEQVTRNDH
jgi:hypothetical protein